MQLPVYSFSHTRVEFVCVYCCSVAAQTPRSFFNSPRNHSASLFSMPLAAVIFARYSASLCSRPRPATPPS